MNDETDIAMQFAASLEKRMRVLKTKEQEHEDTVAPPLLQRLPPPLDLEETVSPELTVEDDYSTIESVAAVSGWFHPDDLFDKATGEQARQLILSRLAPLSMVDTSGDQVRWCLKQNAREKVLSRLKDQSRLQETLEQKLPPTDTFGER